MRWYQPFKKRLVAVVALAAFAVAWVSLPRVASAQDGDGDSQVQACAEAYEQAQVNRNNGKLVEAQEHLRVCVQDVCPDFVKSDCGQWLSDIRRDVPSVIFTAVNSKGKEMVDVKVTLDGEEVTLDGRSVELNPGQHEVSYEFEGDTQTEKVVIRQGEKNRVIKLEVETEKDSDGDGILDAADACPDEAGIEAEAGCPPRETSKAPPPSNDGLRMGAYIGWGVGGAGLITGTVFGLMGSSAESEAIAECGDNNSENCPNGQWQGFVDDVDTKFLVANIGWVAGGVGAVTGTVLYILSIPSGSEEQTGVQVGVLPSARGGGVLSLSGAF